MRLVFTAPGRPRFVLSALVALAASAAAPAGFDPSFGPGTLGIPAADPRFVGWAAGVADLTRGPQSVAVPGGPLASFGTAAAALGPVDNAVVSLGDGGRLTLTFAAPIADGPGADFAVFENGFAAGGLRAFLELAHVEVSSNGTDFVRFPSVSLTPADAQVGGFGLLDGRDLHNLAGKHVAGLGTPFDLAELAGGPLLDVGRVTHVRLVDVVGSIDPRFGSRDSLGNLINDPFATPFASSGFDLEAVGVIHAVSPVPVPPTAGLAALGAVAVGLARSRRSAAAAASD